MNKAFVIIFPEEILDENLEAIRSHFISKKYSNTVILISTPVENNSRIVYRLIESKLKNKALFLVIQFDKFFGNIPAEVTAWIKSTFPDFNLRTDEKND